MNSSAHPPFIQAHNQGVLIAVRVTPKAKQSGITGIRQGELKVSVCAPPQDGKANQELIKLLSKTLKVPKSQIEIVRGETSRSKTLLIHTVNMDHVKQSLEETGKIQCEIL